MKSRGAKNRFVMTNLLKGLTAIVLVTSMGTITPLSAEETGEPTDVITEEVVTEEAEENVLEVTEKDNEDTETEETDVSDDASTNEYNVEEVIENEVITEIEEVFEVSYSGQAGPSATWALNEGTLTISGNGSILREGYDNLANYANDIKKVIIQDGITSIGNNYFNGLTQMESITIPNTVKSIGDFAFLRCENLKALVIPSGVTVINRNLCNGCSKLESVSIPEGVTSIGMYAFSGCKSLKSVNIPNGVKSIGESAFGGCEIIESIVIPNGVTTIENNTFIACYKLKSVTLHDDIISIGMYAFNNCKSLEQITLPKNLKSLGNSAFGVCPSLKMINLPEGVTTIGPGAFQACTNLEQITIPESVTTLGASAFRSCTKLKTVTLPKNVTVINDNLFSKCESLAQLTIHENITKIDMYAFNECKSLEQLTISNNVTEIGENAFKDSGLKDIYYESDEQNWKKITTSIGTDGIPSFTVVHFKSSGADNFERLYGKGRYETSLDLADKFHEIKGNFDNVIIAYGENFPDALSGGYLASQTNAPIIIVKNDATIEQNVLDYLKANANPKAKIMILGSSSVVSSSFENQLKNLGMNFNVVRYGGATRFETNIAILEAGGIKKGSNGTLFVSSANGFADSLSASSAGVPLLIANAELTQDQITFLN
ncbi:MAG: leucine-rich repeat protein, partial [Erysipelotrichaceae bacterium]|nr:leucine-rich repeat protein [Erysipelotrichaceae bacterium]